MDTFEISLFLKNLNKQQTSRGECIACGTLVQWCRISVKTHKRANCPQASAEELKLFSKKNETSPQVFQISDYLCGFDNSDGRGSCIACQMKVQWNRASVATHVRSTCSNSTEADRILFLKREANSFDLEDPIAPVLIEATSATSKEYDVGDFLNHSQTYRGKGECRACSTVVQWSRQKLAQHKRSTCSRATEQEKEFFALKPSEKAARSKENTEGSFRIHDFLDRSDAKLAHKGRCRACGAYVQWSRMKLAQHIRSTCPRASEEDKRSFSKEVFGTEGSRKFEPGDMTDSFHVTDYLDRASSTAHKGICKVCGVSVQWSRMKIAQHMRSTCADASEETKRQFSKEVFGTEGSKKSIAGASRTFTTTDYLKNLNKITGRGTCKTCDSLVQWSRSKVESHKRSTCSRVTKEENIFFRKRESDDSDCSTTSDDEKNSELEISRMSTKNAVKLEVFDLNEYLDSYDAKRNLGTCRTCGDTVQWSRSRLAAHKRATCRQATPDERAFFAAKTRDRPRKTISSKSKAGAFAVSNFLRDFNSQLNKGHCIACDMAVQWSRQKLAQHIRSTCPNATSEQKLFFKSDVNKKAEPSDDEEYIDEYFYENLIETDYERQGNSVEVDNRLAADSDCSSDGLNMETPEDPVSCFVCNESFGHRRPIQLTKILSFTRTPLYRILELFTGEELSVQTMNRSVVCQDCFINMEKYDKFQRKSKELQEKITEMYIKTHNEPESSSSRTVLIKQEPELDINETVYFTNFLSQDTAEHSQPTPKSKLKRRRSSSPPAKIVQPFASDNFQTSPSLSSMFVCYKCGKPCQTQHGTRIHLVTEHKQSESDFECPECPKVFPDKSSFRSHFYSHKPKTGFLCVRCGTIFANKKYYKRHHMVHDDLRPYKCRFEGCEKSFRTLVNLSTHHRVHTQEKIFECPFCPGKKFAAAWGRTLHLRSHHKGEHSKPGALSKGSSSCLDLF